MDITPQPLSRDLLKQMTRKEMVELLEAEQDVRKIFNDRIKVKESFTLMKPLTGCWKETRRLRGIFGVFPV